VLYLHVLYRHMAHLYHIISIAIIIHMLTAECMESSTHLIEAVFEIVYVWSHENFESMIHEEIHPNISNSFLATEIGSWTINPSANLEYSTLELVTEACIETQSYSSKGEGYCKKCRECLGNETLISACSLEGDTLCSVECPSGSVPFLVIPYEYKFMCTYCPRGKYAFEGRCQNCPNGYYASSVGMSHCSECQKPNFTTSPESGYTQCYPVSFVLHMQLEPPLHI